MKKIFKILLILFTTKVAAIGYDFDNPILYIENRPVYLHEFIGYENLDKIKYFTGPEWTKENLEIFKSIYPRNAIRNSGIDIQSGLDVYRQIVEGIVNQYVFTYVVNEVVREWIPEHQWEAYENAIKKYIHARHIYDESRIVAFESTNNEAEFLEVFEEMLSNSPVDIEWLPVAGVYGPTKALQPYSSAIQNALPLVNKDGEAYLWAYQSELIGLVQILLMDKIDMELETLIARAKKKKGFYKCIYIEGINEDNRQLMVKLVHDYINENKISTFDDLIFKVHSIYPDLILKEIRLSGEQINKDFNTKPWDTNNGDILGETMFGNILYFIADNKPSIPENLNLYENKMYGFLYRFAVDYYFKEAYNNIQESITLPNDYSFAELDYFFLRPTAINRSPFLNNL